MLDKVTEIKNKTIVGVVANCEKLNVRCNPNKDADVVCIIDAGTVVVIDERKSTYNFYNVCTETGVCGYCMCEFIDIKET